MEPRSEEAARLQVNGCTDSPPDISPAKKEKVIFVMHTQATNANNLTHPKCKAILKEMGEQAILSACSVHRMLLTGNVFPSLWGSLSCTKDMGMKTAQAAARKMCMPIPNLTNRFTYLRFTEAVLST